MKKFLKIHLPSISFAFFIISNPLSASNVGGSSTILEHSTYSQEFLSVVEDSPKNTHVLSFGGDASPVKRSLIYGEQLCYPTVTMLHPYNPTDGERISCGIAGVPLVASFPPALKKSLPSSIQQLLNNEKVQDADLKIFFYAQDFPWNDKISICLRPHYATEPDAPTFGATKNRDITAGVFNIREEGSVTLEGQRNTSRTSSISTHPGEASLTILSPNNLHVTGLNSQKGQSFWSYVGYKQDSGKPSAIVTLHSILTDDEYKTLSGALQSTFGDDPKDQIEEKIYRLIHDTQANIPSFDEGRKLMAEYLSQ